MTAGADPTVHRAAAVGSRGAHAGGPLPPRDQLDRWSVWAACGHDERAFEQLVRAHTPSLYVGALRATGSRELAEEVLQDAWLSAWTHLAGFRGHSSVRTWLVRIVTTKALNALRRPHPTLPLDTVPEPASAGTEERAERADRIRAVRRAVAALPGRQRDSVVLCDLEGLSYAEVAAALGCTESSVRSALHRGRGALAAALAAYGPAHVEDDRDDRTSRLGSADTAQALTGQLEDAHHDLPLDVAAPGAKGEGVRAMAEQAARSSHGSGDQSPCRGRSTTHARGPHAFARPRQSP